MSEHGSTSRNHAVSSLFVFCLIAVFALLATVLTLFGIRAYRSVYDASAGNSESQTALSYLVNKLHSADRAQGVEIRAEGGRDVLVLAEPLDGTIYETRIYCDGGSLREYFCEQGEPFDAELGEELASLNALRLTLEKPWLIRVELDQPDGRQLSAHVALRGEVAP